MSLHNNGGGAGSSGSVNLNVLPLPKTSSQTQTDLTPKTNAQTKTHTPTPPPPSSSSATPLSQHQQTQRPPPPPQQSVINEVMPLQPQAQTQSYRGSTLAAGGIATKPTPASTSISTSTPSGSTSTATTTMTTTTTTSTRIIPITTSANPGPRPIISSTPSLNRNISSSSNNNNINVTTTNPRSAITTNTIRPGVPRPSATPSTTGIAASAPGAAVGSARPSQPLVTRIVSSGPSGGGMTPQQRRILTSLGQQAQAQQTQGQGQGQQTTGNGVVGRGAPTTTTRPISISSAAGTQGGGGGSSATAVGGPKAGVAVGVRPATPAVGTPAMKVVPGTVGVGATNGGRQGGVVVGKGATGASQLVRGVSGPSNTTTAPASANKQPNIQPTSTPTTKAPPPAAATIRSTPGLGDAASAARQSVKRAPPSSSSSSVDSSLKKGPAKKRKKEESPSETGNANGSTSTNSAPTTSKESLEKDKDKSTSTPPSKNNETDKSKKVRACVYCRRSHMVCEQQRPCARCIKRGIEHLCLDDARVTKAAVEASGSGGAPTILTDYASVSPGPKPVSATATAAGTSATGKRIKQKTQVKDSSPVHRTAFTPNYASTSTTAQPTSTGMQRVLSNTSDSSTSSASSRNYMRSGGSGRLGDVGMLDLPPGMHPSWPLLPDKTTTTTQSRSWNSHSHPTPGLGLDVAPSHLNAPRDHHNNHHHHHNSSTRDSMLMDYRDHVVGGVGAGDGVERVTSGMSAHLGAVEIDQLGSLFSLDNTSSSRFGAGTSAAQGGEFGALSDFLESLGIPSLPGGLGDIFSEEARLENNHNNNNLESGGGDLDGWGATVSGEFRSQGQGKNQGPSQPSRPYDGISIKQEEDDQFQRADKILSRKTSKAERYLLAAADQPTGSRDERLKRVIKAKYEAGLLKPYDYSRGYARMYKWMEKNVSPATKQAILRALSVFRPAFRAIAQSLSDIDLVFVEEMFERLMLDYDRVFSAIHTPACLWRRTGEIYKANKEFSTLTGIPSAYLRGGKLGIYQLMSEESVVRYYQLLGSIAFDADHRSVNTMCVLRIPKNLSRAMTSTTTPMMSANSGLGAMSTSNGLATTSGGSTGANHAGSASGDITMDQNETPISSPYNQQGALPQQSTSTSSNSAGGINSGMLSPGNSIPNNMAAPPMSKTSSSPISATGAAVGGNVTPAASSSVQGVTPVGMGSANAGQQQQQQQQQAVEYRQIKCCFSFTIRRDQWGIPIALVGNWIPS